MDRRHVPRGGGEAHAWWDMGTCKVPRGMSAQDFLAHVQQRLWHAVGSRDAGVTCLCAAQPCAAMDGVEFLCDAKWESSPATTHVQLDVLTWAWDHPPPSHLLLLSGDPALELTTIALTHRGYHVTLVGPEEWAPQAGASMAEASMDAAMEILEGWGPREGLSASRPVAAKWAPLEGIPAEEQSVDEMGAREDDGGSEGGAATDSHGAEGAARQGRLLVGPREAASQDPEEAVGRQQITAFLCKEPVLEESPGPHGAKGEALPLVMLQRRCHVGRRREKTTALRREDLVLEALWTLREEEIEPTERNLQARITYVIKKHGLAHILTSSAESYISADVARGAVVENRHEGRKIFLPAAEGDVWPCVDPRYPLDVYGAETWIALKEFLLSPMGSDLLTSSKSRYHAAESLQHCGPPELQALPLGRLIHVVQLAVTLRNWLCPQARRWGPLRINTSAVQAWWPAGQGAEGSDHGATGGAPPHGASGEEGPAREGTDEGRSSSSRSSDTAAHAGPVPRVHKAWVVRKGTCSEGKGEGERNELQHTLGEHALSMVPRHSAWDSGGEQQSARPHGAGSAGEEALSPQSSKNGWGTVRIVEKHGAGSASSQVRSGGWTTRRHASASTAAKTQADYAKVRQDLEWLLRARLDSPEAQHEGYPMAQLHNDFRNVHGYSLDFKAMGFSKLKGLLGTMPHVVAVRHAAGGHGLLFAPGTPAPGTLSDDAERRPKPRTSTAWQEGRGEKGVVSTRGTPVRDDKADGSPEGKTLLRGAPDAVDRQHRGSGQREVLGRGRPVPGGGPKEGEGRQEHLEGYLTALALDPQTDLRWDAAPAYGNDTSAASGWGIAATPAMGTAPAFGGATAHASEAFDDAGSGRRVSDVENSVPAKEEEGGPGKEIEPTGEGAVAGSPEATEGLPLVDSPTRTLGEGPSRDSPQGLQSGNLNGTAAGAELQTALAVGQEQDELSAMGDIAGRDALDAAPASESAPGPVQQGPAPHHGAEPDITTGGERQALAGETQVEARAEQGPGRAHAGVEGHEGALEQREERHMAQAERNQAGARDAAPAQAPLKPWQRWLQWALRLQGPPGGTEAQAPPSQDDPARGQRPEQPDVERIVLESLIQSMPFEQARVLRAQGTLQPGPSGTLDERAGAGGANMDV